MQLEIELAKLGITIDDLVSDAEDVPELKPVFARLKSEEARQRVAVEWFGDKGNPQPEKRVRRIIAYFGPDAYVEADPTPDWGRLPRLDGDEASGRAETAGRDLPPLPNVSQLNSFAYGTLERAVKKLGRDATEGEVVSSKLPPQDARRVRRMMGARLLRLSPTRKLVVDERVARKGPRYVLRYLDENGTRWLDPNIELRGR